MSIYIFVKKTVRTCNRRDREATPLNAYEKDGEERIGLGNPSEKIIGMIKG